VLTPQQRTTLAAKLRDRMDDNQFATK